MKASALEVLRYLKRTRRYVDVRDVFFNCPTNTPTKRLSELNDAGLIQKRRDPKNPKYCQYRAV